MPTGTVESLTISTEVAELLDVASSVLDRHFGIPFRLYDSASLEPIATSNTCLIPADVPSWLRHAAADNVPVSAVFVHPISDHLQALVLPLGAESKPHALAVGVFRVQPPSSIDQQTQIAPDVADGLDPGPVPYCDPELLRRLGVGALAAILEKHKLHVREAELGQLASQVSRNYEEITLLHQLTREAQVSHGVRALQESTLSLLADMLPARQIAFVSSNDATVLFKGETVLGSAGCRELTKLLGNCTRQRALVENHVAALDWSHSFPELDRLIVVPVVESKEHFGWLLALGTMDGSELGSVEASLMTAVAAILATHQTNVKLFANVKELFLGIVRALSTAIDAKDPYTCGHSERVARIARRIGQEMGLPDDERNRLYLAGLLHDIGKIGIRDAVLLKPGRLTPEEMLHIQEHPKIGFDILHGVKQLKPVLSGVRNHHENFDGTGYPDKLKAEEIPLLARILAVADSYDAMSSDRPYRKGLDQERVQQIFREGMDQQWDKRIVQAFLTIREEVQEKQPAKDGSAQNGRPPEQQPSAQASLSQRLDLSKICEFIAMDNS